MSLNATNVNDTILFNWNYGWCSENMPSSRPLVNPLIKAMLNENPDEMEQLFCMGAEIEKTDSSTFERALYHVVNNYQVMKCLVSHGYTNILPDFPIYSYNECIGPDGYMWGVTARAWFLKAYDVMELLVQHGFDGFSYCINGYGNDIDDEMFRIQDIRGMTILLEHGYLRDSLKNLMKKYPNSPMTQYFKNNFLIQRKSLGIDPFKFKEIPKPQLEKKGLFHRNEIQRKNDLLLADYQDWLRAHEEYLVSLSKDKLIKISELNKSNKDIADLMIRVANVK